MKKESALPLSGAVYSMYIKELKRYGAYQILQADLEGICYIVLDYLEEVPPNPKEITSFQPLYQERFQCYHQLEICRVSNTKVPKDYLFIGVYPPAAKDDWNCFCEEWRDGKEYIYEKEWDTADPKQRDAYKKYCNSNEVVKVGKRYFKKNLNGIRTELYQIAGKEFSVERFPCVTFVEVEGVQEGLIKCLEHADLIHTLRWNSPQTERLDLRKTAIRCLELDAGGVKEIYLSEKIKRIELNGKIDSQLRIYGEPKAYDLSLSVVWQPEGIFSYGLEHVGELQVLDIRELDLKNISFFFPGLTGLILEGHPGVLSGLNELESFFELRELKIKDLFGYTVEEVESFRRLPELRKLYLSSVPQEVGRMVYREWRGKLDSLKVNRLRSEEWLKENLENPFRHWEGSEGIPAGAAKKAFKQYKRTKHIFAQALDKEAIILAVKEYAACFNRFNHYYAEFIETEEREDIFSSLRRIYQETLIEERGWIEIEEVMELLDREREDW